MEAITITMRASSTSLLARHQHHAALTLPVPGQYGYCNGTGRLSGFYSRWYTTACCRSICAEVYGGEEIDIDL